MATELDLEQTLDELHRSGEEIVGIFARLNEESHNVKFLRFDEDGEEYIFTGKLRDGRQAVIRLSVHGYPGGASIQARSDQVPNYTHSVAARPGPKSIKEHVERIFLAARFYPQAAWCHVQNPDRY